MRSAQNHFSHFTWLVCFDEIVVLFVWWVRVRCPSTRIRTWRVSSGFWLDLQGLCWKISCMKSLCFKLLVVISNINRQSRLHSTRRHTFNCFLFYPSLNFPGFSLIFLTVCSILRRRKICQRNDGWLNLNLSNRCWLLSNNSCLELS